MSGRRVQLYASEAEMTHDDTTPPNAVPRIGEPYPLATSDQVESLQRQNDALRAENSRLLTGYLRRGQMLATDREAFHGLAAGSHRIDAITDELGDARSMWYEQPRYSVPIQGGG